MAGKMEQWVALLRGVNVGGGNRLPMADLTAACQRLGWQDVQSYIASGNLVFRATGPSRTLAGEAVGMLQSEFGLDVPVLILPGDVVRAALEECPFDPADPRHVHIAFLFSPPEPDHELIASLAAPGEELRIGTRVGWLHAPAGIGRSKLASGLERALGSDLTARNLRTVRKLVAMLDAQ